MNQKISDFVEKSSQKSFDLPHRGIINYNIGKYDVAVGKGLSRLDHLEFAKRKVIL